MESIEGGQLFLSNRVFDIGGVHVDEIHAKSQRERGVTRRHGRDSQAFALSTAKYVRRTTVYAATPTAHSQSSGNKRS